MGGTDTLKKELGFSTAEQICLDESQSKQAIPACTFPAMIASLSSGKGDVTVMILSPALIMRVCPYVPCCTPMSASDKVLIRSPPFQDWFTSSHKLTIHQFRLVHGAVTQVCQFKIELRKSKSIIKVYRQSLIERK